MKRHLLSVLLLCLCGAIPPETGSHARPLRLLDDYCELMGQVFVETNPGFADYRVYVEDNEAFAEMLVYKEDVSSFATEAGYWYFTDVKGFADFSIYLEEVPGFADFTVAYTTFRASAGCK